MAAIPPQIPGLTDWRALARGGFATVWVARQESLNRLVAVKVDQRTLDSDSEQRRFLREAGAVGRMSGHPGIVTVHDAGILTDDRPYLVMELCEGGSLTKWVKAEKRPSAKQVQDVGVRIADALAATHTRGVVHRDVKPANILIDSYGHAGLADFGLAALPDPGMDLSETFDAITPAYAPPEVFQRKPFTEVGDVYSLGATLYALLAGSPPRWCETGAPTSADMLQRQEEPIERIPGLDDGMMDVLLRAMATDPADRPTAAEFRDQLSELNLEPPPPEARRAAAPTPVLASGESDEKEPITDPWPERGGRKRSRRRRSGILVAAVMVLASAAAISLVNLLPGPVSGAPPVASPSLSASPAVSTSSQATPTPTRTRTPAPSPKDKVPASYLDCSDKLGAGTYCTPEPECWTGVRGYANAPLAGEPVSCYELHYYQTFAAGELDFIPVHQSELEALPQVRRVCNPKVVNRMLAKNDQREKWEVHALPRQKQGEMHYRCIFGPWARTLPVQLTKPR